MFISHSFQSYKAQVGMCVYVTFMALSFVIRNYHAHATVLWLVFYFPLQRHSVPVRETLSFKGVSVSGFDVLGKYLLSERRKINCPASSWPGLRQNWDFVLWSWHGAVSSHSSFTLFIKCSLFHQSMISWLEGGKEMGQMSSGCAQPADGVSSYWWDTLSYGSVLVSNSGIYSDLMQRYVRQAET